MNKVTKQDNKRKNIPNKLRFEVFKRDSFTCQYCTNWTDWRETMLMVISDMEAINQECEEWSVQDNSLNGGGQ